MWYRNLILLLLLVVSVFEEANSQTITEIRFIGLKRTKYSYLKNNIVKSKIGQELDSTRLQKDVQELLNLKHFNKINYVIIPNDSTNSTVEVHFILSENYSLLPNLDIGLSKDNFRFQVGVVDYNALGRGGGMNLYYKYQGRSTYFYNGDYPFLLGGKKGFGIDLYKNAVYEPFYYNQKKLEYSYDLYAALLFLRLDLNIHNYFRFGIGYQYEEFSPSRRDTVINESPLYGKSNRVFLRLNYKHSKLKLVRANSKGLVFEANATQIFSDALLKNGIYDNKLSGSSIKFLTEIKYFFNIYPSGNTALRLRTGLSKAPLFDQFVLDDNTNIRGLGFRKVRRETEFVFNFEHRQTVFENRYGSIQLLAFNDFTPGYNYFGTGIRFYVEKLHGMVLRTDYGMNIKDLKQAGIVAGIYQYF